MSHAILSPSSAARWLHCPPSALLNAQAGSADTKYTREGTLAHAAAELAAHKRFLPGLGPKKFAAEMTKLKADEYWDDEMITHVQTYLDALMDIYAAFPVRPHVVLEQKVDFHEYVPDGYGTADCIMLCGDILQVVDFKYGQGVEVSADHNPQMML